MLWEELTSDEFAAAVQAVDGVCLIPLSCIERHGPHMPLGTDFYIARELCRRAAALEAALIFPDVIFTQILEARQCAGTIAVDPALTLQLLDNVCREVARNGLDKIVLVNAHGGNTHLLHYFAQLQLASPRDYVLYLPEPTFLPEDEAAILAQWESSVDGHAGESETSQILAIRPDLVHLDTLNDRAEGMPRNRGQALRDAGVYTGIWWYADHPTHYRGDGATATAAKGEAELNARARALANVIRMVRSDDVTPALEREFHAGAAAPSRR